MYTYFKEMADSSCSAFFLLQFCLLVCSLCTFLAVLGRYIPGVVISYVLGKSAQALTHISRTWIYGCDA